MFEGCSNSKKKGDAGLGAAIGFFTLRGDPVSIPLTDSQDYDLVVEIEGVLSKVQVKTTGSRKPNGNYTVGLRVLGGNAKTNHVHKLGNEIVYDYLFVLTSAGDRFFIPREKFVEHRNSLVLGEKFLPFKV